jgi:Bacillus/Clostridium GerA spore germination protein.
VNIANNPAFTSMLVYIDNMIDISTIEQSIIGKLTTKNEDASLNLGSKEYSQYLLGVRNEDIYTDINKVIDSILSGNLVQFINGIAEALVVNINNPPSRTIEEPEVETAIRGPREGFTESISTNITLIRKKLKVQILKLNL